MGGIYNMGQLIKKIKIFLIILSKFDILSNISDSYHCYLEFDCLTFVLEGSEAETVVGGTESARGVPVGVGGLDARERYQAIFTALERRQGVEKEQRLVWGLFFAPAPDVDGGEAVEEFGVGGNHQIK